MEPNTRKDKPSSDAVGFVTKRESLEVRLARAQRKLAVGARQRRSRRAEELSRAKDLPISI